MAHMFHDVGMSDVVAWAEPLFNSLRHAGRMVFRGDRVRHLDFSDLL
jgi:hypothetical protein